MLENPAFSKDMDRQLEVALVRVLGDDRYDANTADHNVGLLYLATIAEQVGAISTLFDPYDHTLYKEGQGPLLSKKFNIVGFTIHYLNIEHTLQVSRNLKTLFPETLIVFGGHHASAAADDLLRDHKFIDIVCVGEGEDVLTQLILELQKGTPANALSIRGVFRPKSFIDLDQLPFSPRPKALTIARISTSRGCPYSCSFCTTPAMRALNKEPIYRVCSPKYVVDEIEDLYNQGTKKIYINDDLYAMNNQKSKERAIEIADEIIRRNIRISYKAQLRVDSFTLQDKKLLNHLRKSGLREVFLGIESGSDVTLSRYNKQATLQDNINALRLYDDAGIKINAGNIVASPDSTIEEICDSISAFQKMQIAYLFFRRVTFKVIALPGTALERQLEIQERLERKPRYLLRNYSFQNSRVGDVVDLLESAMPQFLKDGGSEAFRLRNRALILYYENKLTKKNLSVELLTILSDWNGHSARFLLRWFRDYPHEKINEKIFSYELQQYLDQVKVIKQRLTRVIGISSLEDFDGDTF